MAAGDVTVDKNVKGFHALSDLVMVVGTVTLDGANPTPIDLSAYMKAVTWAMVAWETDTAQAVDPTTVTHTLSGQTVNVHAWKVTSNSNPTLIASTNNSNEVSFIAFGTRLS